jgi:hypothetical protein
MTPSPHLHNDGVLWPTFLRGVTLCAVPRRGRGRPTNWY